MRLPFPELLAVLALLAACGLTAKAQLVIDGTFESSITDLSDAATVEAGIDQAIARIESDVLTSDTVNIAFADSSSVDLGESDTYYNDLPYSTYLSDLENHQTLSANDTTALASLPAGPDNPVDGNADVKLTLPLLRAIGQTALGNNSGTPGELDSTITLNLSKMYVSRAAVSSSENDLQAVVGHEVDEVLGIGGAGSTLLSGTTGPVGPMDLFRYGATGVRSFTQSDTAVSYFSINGGATNLVNFNQNGENDDSDFGDWGNGASPAEIAGNDPPQLQDAYGAEGVNVDVGTNELIALDVVGYTVVPEPSIACLAIAGLILMSLRGRREKPPRITEPSG